MDLLQTLLVYMSLVFASSVQTAPEPAVIPETPEYLAAVVEVTPEPTAVPTPVPTIDITPNPGYKTLQVGDRGDNVRQMQEKLQEYGYYAGELDGAYGNQTRKAVEHFQYMHGLSADGIAGRRTLTVLYESSEIRLPVWEETLEPEVTASPAATLAAAFTPPPVMIAAAAEPEPTYTREPAAAAEPAQKLDGYTVYAGDTPTEWKAFSRGGTVYLPIVELLNISGVNVISSSTVELDEYAFASGLSFIRFTNTENQQGEPVDLQVYRNDEPQLVPDRSLYRENGILYVPCESIESITGMTCTVKHEEKQIIVDLAE